MQWFRTERGGNYQVGEFGNDDGKEPGWYWQPLWGGWSDPVRKFHGPFSTRQLASNDANDCDNTCISRQADKWG